MSARAALRHQNATPNGPACPCGGGSESFPAKKSPPRPLGQCRARSTEKAKQEKTGDLPRTQSWPSPGWHPSAQKRPQNSHRRATPPGALAWAPPRRHWHRLAHPDEKHCSPTQNQPLPINFQFNIDFSVFLGSFVLLVWERLPCGAGVEQRVTLWGRSWAGSSARPPHFGWRWWWWCPKPRPKP